MSKLSNLEKLIKLNGDEQKYSEGLQILNSGITNGGSGALVNLAIGVTLVTIGIALNPGLQSQFKDLLLKVSTTKVDSDSVTESANDPPLPPEIKQAPLPPEPLPTTTYYSVPQGQSLVYRP